MDGKIVKEVTETKTLRVSHDTSMDLKSYKLVANTINKINENLNLSRIEDLNRTILSDESDSSDTITDMKVNSENHIYNSQNSLIEYDKLIASIEEDDKKTCINNNVIKNYDNLNLLNSENLSNLQKNINGYLEQNNDIELTSTLKRVSLNNTQDVLR